MQRFVHLRPTVLSTLLLVAAAGCTQSRDVPPQRHKAPGVQGGKAEPTAVAITAPPLASGKGVTSARYQTRPLDSALEELRQRDEDWKAEQKKKSGKIRDAQKERKDQEREQRKQLRSSLSEEGRPTSLEAFETVHHQPPTPQFRTGTCWSFAATSFLESEAKRIAKQDVKLSEMATVYWEYVAKGRRFVAERGESNFSQGSEPNAVPRMWAAHGAWPIGAYPGVVGDEPRHDHQRLSREMKGLLESLREQSMWDEAAAGSMLQVLLDRHLGPPPERFDVDGQSFTPQRFMSERLKIQPSDYVSLMSTLSVPFWTQGTFDVPDNWWRDDSYYNLPLDDFYGALKGAIRAGYSLVVAIDVSEPGKDPEGDVMFVPDYDIPPSRIDQLAREVRLGNKATTDDHGVHLVGWAEHAGHDWFLVKDSGRSARRGKQKGYYFVRDDYVLLKVLAFMVHKDAVQELLGKFEPPEAADEAAQPSPGSR